jgi:hypothetical protein
MSRVPRPKKAIDSRGRVRKSAPVARDIEGQRTYARLLLAYVRASRGEGSAYEQACYEELEWRLCSASLEFFIDRYAWLKMKGGPPVRWKMWPRQRILCRRYEYGEDMAIYSTRQVAKTSLFLHGMLHRCIFRTGWTGTFMSATLPLAEEARSRIDITQELLPDWMTARANLVALEPDTRSEDGRKNVRTPKRRTQDGVRVIKTGLSTFRIVAATRKQMQGPIGDVTVDQIEAMDDQHEKLAALRPVYSEVGGKKGQFIALANGGDRGGMHDLYHEARAGKYPVSAYFFSFLFNPDRTWEWWHSELEQAAQLDPVNGATNFRRQNPAFPEDLWASAESVVFSPSALARARADAETVKAANEAIGMAWPLRGRLTRDTGQTLGPGEFRGGGWAFVSDHYAGNLWVYEPPMPGARYVVFGDPKGYGEDKRSSAAGLQVLRLTELDLIQVARSRTNLAPELFATLLVDTAETYGALLGWFTHGRQGGTLDARIKDRRYRPLYYRLRSESGPAKRSDLPGYDETGRQAKKNLMERLAEKLHHGELLLYDLATIEELENLYVTERGVIEPRPGYYDDLAESLGGAVIAAETAPKSFTARNTVQGYDTWTGQAQYGPGHSTWET